MSEAEVKELVDLLDTYGQAVAGDSWWPGNAAPHIGVDKADRLLDLLHKIA